MIILSHSRGILLGILLLLFLQHGLACSMYKITLYGKTMVGCNEDAWRLTPRIWFENKTKNTLYGAAFSGSRFDGSNGFAPQSGMNECGLAFSRLAAREPGNKSVFTEPRLQIKNPTHYLKDILHNCKTVEEVKNYISRFDHSFFKEDVFIYIEPSGAYLIVEPYTLTIGHKPNYVLSNFCPSVTSEKEALELNRYRNGVTFLSNKADTSLAFCTALSDTMHVCRKKTGDGTLLSSIWDLSERKVSLYFYHDYTKLKQFNLATELKKGDHILDVAALFPPNAEFEKLARHQTPYNNPLLLSYLVLLALLFVLSAFIFLLYHLQGKKTYSLLSLPGIPLALIAAYYIYQLTKHAAAFYFPAPYIFEDGLLPGILSYTPYLLLTLSIPMLLINKKIFSAQDWKVFPRFLFTLNSLCLLVLLLLFNYWELF